MHNDQFLWTEKYRPQTIDDCIIPMTTKKIFTPFIEKKELPNFIFSGTAGIGKTTVAKALCNEIGADCLFINGSNEGRLIDTLRMEIVPFASTVSLTDSPKVIIIDEADYMNASTVQPALRSLIEMYSKNCRFIFTCNYKSRIIDPIISRCQVVEFAVQPAHKAMMAAKMYKRVVSILNAEGITYDKSVLPELITRYFPDFRKTLIELQSYSATGTIDSGILLKSSHGSYSEMLEYLKNKEWLKLREWVAENSDIDTFNLFRWLYDNSINIMEPLSVALLVSILAEYDYKSAFVADKEINLVCALTEIMKTCKFT